MTQRRYDIDWLRVIAIGLLIIYHAAIGFQPWGGLIQFIQNTETLEWIWYPMSMLNMWRIPILFFVSGMGVYFSMKKRNFLQLLLERSRRILLPFVFGILVIVPIHILIWQHYYFQDLKYSVGQSHLWFLQNIFTYTLLLAPLFYVFRKLRRRKWMDQVSKWMNQAVVFSMIALLFILESFIIQPDIYTLYGFTTHGWVMGFISFAMGFLMIGLGAAFWNGFKTWKWFYLILAILLFIIRISIYDLEAPDPLMSLESCAWIFSVFGFFQQYANRNSPPLAYLSKAAYPVYIIHMIIQYGISSLIFPLNINANIKWLILTLATLALSLLFYEFFIRRIKWIRPLFGLNYREKALKN